MTGRSETMLVLGATGQQGGATARALVAEGVRVRALVRDEQSVQARALAALGVERVRGDFSDAASLERAMGGVHGVFAALPSSADVQYGLTDDDEVRFGLAVIDAAKRAGVRDLLYSSTIGASPDLGLGHYESKWRIEQSLRQNSVPFTIVRPAPFMELLLAPAFGLRQGALTFFGAPDQRIQFIAVPDVGALSAKLLLDPARPLGLTLDIASDALSGNELAVKISRATGRHVPYTQFSPEAVAGSPLLAHLLQAMTRGKLTGHADLPALRALHPGLLTFDQWLAAGHSRDILGLLPPVASR